MSSPTSEQFRRPFTLAGVITAWNVVTRELTILGYTLRLAPLVSTWGSNPAVPSWWPATGSRVPWEWS